MAADVAAPTLLSPLPAGVETRFTSGFGPRTNPVTKQYQSLHNGQDIGVAANTPILAVAPGRVTTSSFTDTSGNYVKVDHGGGWSTAYLHLNERRAQVGDLVKAGQTIGLSGSTGRSTGPHLHFIVYNDGNPVDPRPLVRWDVQVSGPIDRSGAPSSGGMGLLIPILSSALILGALYWRRRSRAAEV